MSSEITMMAEQCRLQEWAAQIRDCQSRPTSMSVVEWCACHGITKANYYYRLRRVRKACPETIQNERPAQKIVPVQSEILQHQELEDGNPQSGLDISIKRFFIHVTQSTFMPLLESVLKAVQHA